MEDTTIQQETQQPPQVDFTMFLGELVQTGHLYLQGIRNPETDEVVVNLGFVKHIIETIEMLEEKTKGNLTAPESNYLANTLYELRMGYVRAISRQEEAAHPEEARMEDTENETDAENSENPS